MVAPVIVVMILTISFEKLSPILCPDPQTVDCGGKEFGYTSYPVVPLFVLAMTSEPPSVFRDIAGPSIPCSEQKLDTRILPETHFPW